MPHTGSILLSSKEVKMAKATITVDERLGEKTALALYRNYLIYRYNFSRVIAESLYKDARYFQLLFDNSKREDGQIIYYGVQYNEPAGKALKACKYVGLILTLRHPGDNKIHAKKGLTALRRHKLKRITDEAELQGGPLTQEDCADILNTNRSTIIRDIAVLKREGVEITTRAHFTDQGRGISHKERIIKLYLQGFSVGEISNKVKHDISNVQRYIYDFLRINLLHQEGRKPMMIARLTKVSKRLAEEHIKLYEELERDYQYCEPLRHKLAFYASQLNRAATKKKAKERVNGQGSL